VTFDFCSQACKEKFDREPLRDGRLITPPARRPSG
jgi:hypothetical protein